MRVYVIHRSTKGIVNCTVRHTEGQGETLPAKRLPQANLHSPTGFECGYAGSGPADLAASILADFFDVNVRRLGNRWRGKGRPPRSESVDKALHESVDKVIHLHQYFKAAVISKIVLGRGDRREISGDEIVAWLCKFENDEKTAAEAKIEG